MKANLGGALDGAGAGRPPGALRPRAPAPPPRRSLDRPRARCRTARPGGAALALAICPAPSSLPQQGSPGRRSAAGCGPAPAFPRRDLAVFQNRGLEGLAIARTPSAGRARWHCCSGWPPRGCTRSRPGRRRGSPLRLRSSPRQGRPLTLLVRRLPLLLPRPRGASPARVGRGGLRS